MQTLTTHPPESLPVTDRDTYIAFQPTRGASSVHSAFASPVPVLAPLGTSDLALRLKGRLLPWGVHRYHDLGKGPNTRPFDGSS